MKIIFLLLLSLLTGCSATKHLDKSSSDPQKEEQTSVVPDIPYQVIENLIGSDLKPALIIYLHSNSGSGTDNKKQMTQVSAGNIEKYIKDNKIPAYFLVPQCDDDASWSGFNPPPRHRGRPSPGMQRPQEPVKCPSYNKYVKALADHYVRELGADSTRIYVFGASMGGDGVWHLINDYPQYFAAVMAAAGAYRGFGLSNIARTPILCTKGTRERKYQEYVQTIEDIKLLGGEVNFQPLKNYDHRSTVDESFTPERIEWVLSHRRKP